MKNMNDFMDYKELRRMVIDMKSQISGTCPPSHWPLGPEDDQPPSPPMPPIF